MYCSQKTRGSERYVYCQPTKTDPIPGKRGQAKFGGWVPVMGAARDRNVALGTEMANASARLCTFAARNVTAGFLFRRWRTRAAGCGLLCQKQAPEQRADARALPY